MALMADTNTVSGIEQILITNIAINFSSHTKYKKRKVIYLKYVYIKALS